MSELELQASSFSHTNTSQLKSSTSSLSDEQRFEFDEERDAGKELIIISYSNLDEILKATIEGLTRDVNNL